jgi:glucosamine--fructose-6-phosphate aminotransferase (isomerizing)
MMAELGAFMETEIAQQPEAVARVAARAAKLGLERPIGVVLYARGTSDHAATYGRYVIESVAGVPVMLGAPSLTSSYHTATRLYGWLAVGVSQSGETNEIATCLAWAASCGAATLAITNDPSSTIAEVAHETLDLGCGEEKAVVATKTFTAECAALAAVGYGWSGRGCDWEPVVSSLNSAVSAPLDERLVDALANAQLGLVLGRGFRYALAGELALKIMEACGVWACAMSWADLMHGPIAAVPEMATTIILPGPSAIEASYEPVSHRLASLGISTYLLASRQAHPERTPAALSPLIDGVFGQRIVLAAARARGRNPDRPSGLTKVTQT